MDLVFIRDLRVDTIVGVYDWERQIKQTLVFDIDMATDIHRAAVSDDLQFAVNYHAVSLRVSSYVEAHHTALIETLAEDVAKLILTEFKVPWVRLQLTKPNAVLGAKSVGVIIERGMQPSAEPVA
ncbi:MAG TPA: dihydroneopterin aldolase [Cellvibrio sp.]|nr:dihydroneopterin aldolase [Cellvibrio sp.]